MEAAGTLERGLAVLRALTAVPAGRAPTDVAPGRALASVSAGRASTGRAPAGRAHPGRMRATDLVRATGLARSTVDRVVATLVHLGYVRADGRDLTPAPRLMELAEAYLTCDGLRDPLAPFAERLAEELDESVSLAVRDGDGVRFIGQFTRRRAMSVAFRVGDLLPADRCAAGLVLLGPPAPWAVDDQLIEPGLIAVAMPVRDAEGRAVCAVSVVSHTSRHTAAGLRDHALPRLRETVAHMEAALATPAPTSTDHPATPDTVAEGAPAPARLASAAPDSTDLPRESQPGRAHALEAPAGPDSAAADLPSDRLAGGRESRNGKEELGAGYLQALARGLAVLMSLGSARGGLSAAGAARATGLPKAAVRRSLEALARLGYATCHDGSRYALLPRVMELGCAALSERGFGEVVRPHLADLVARVGQPASVGVLSGDDVLYVARVPAPGIVSVTITVGSRFPAHATSMGRVLLAARDAADPPSPAVAQAARDGYALVDEELEEGVRSIAVPVCGRGGRVVAAVDVTAHAGRASRADLLRDVLPALTETAARMAADLRHLPASP
ncbi:IclR family transcriptional regulator domain-containing protein [Nonomuraea phyllanthi]|uniref:IclR family transcriptional regulator domain-containing protein n=1 Tax=Nonomuraea phyllanthi TaxID=2219224 RepID=UPI0029500662|nr:IclR family transcriptional regulator C-terminal domain-containing protein [Nonomuraea phyllanthi]